MSLIRDLFAYYFANVVTNLFELYFFVLSNWFLLDYTCVQLFLVSFYFFLERFYRFLFVQKCLKLCFERKNLLFEKIDFILFWFNFLSHFPSTIRKNLFFLLKFTDFILETSQFLLSGFKTLFFIFKFLFFLAHCFINWIKLIFKFRYFLTNLVILRHKLNDFFIRQSAISFQRFDGVGILCSFFRFLVLYISNILTDFVKLCFMFLLNLIDFLCKSLFS